MLIPGWRGRPITNLLYSGVPRALPVARVRLKVGANVPEAAAGGHDRLGTFTIQVAAGPTDLEATLLATRRASVKLI